MRDARLRGLERSASEAGPVDRSAALRARLRTEPPCDECGGEGKVKSFDTSSGVSPLGVACWAMSLCVPCGGSGHGRFRLMLGLAAYVGDAAARLALSEACACGVTAQQDAAALLGQPHGGPGGTPCLDQNFEAWVRGIGGFGSHEAQVRAALAAAEAALMPWANDYCPICRGRGGAPKSHKHVLDPSLSDTRVALEYANKWLSDQTEEAATPAVALGHRAGVPDFVALACFSATLDDPILRPKGGEAARLSVLHAIKWTSQSTVRRAIADRVGSWALERGRA